MHPSPMSLPTWFLGLWIKQKRASSDAGRGVRQSISPLHGPKVSDKVSTFVRQKRHVTVWIESKCLFKIFGSDVLILK